jgi:hypothetical protein
MVISFIKEDGFEYYAHGGAVNKMVGSLNIPGMKFSYYSKNNKIGSVSGEIVDNKLSSEFDFEGNKYSISYNKMDDVNLGTNFDAYKSVLTMDVDKQMEIYNNLYSFDINDSNGKSVGTLKYHISEEHGIHRYYYFTLEIDGMVFYLYFNRNTVMKLKSSFYSFYLDDKLIAMSDNPSVGETEVSAGLTYNMDMKNNLYNIYMEDDKYSKYVCLLVYLLHVLDHEYDYNINESKFYSKELDTKFDYSFIEKVRASEDPQNLPENMDVVKNMVKDTKKTRNNIASKFVIFAIAFILVIFFVTAVVPKNITALIIPLAFLAFVLFGVLKIFKK